MTDETWQLIGTGIFLWVLSGGMACLLLLLIDTIIPTNVVNHFFMTLDPIIGVLLTFLLGPFSIFLPHIYYIPFVYRKWKAIKEKERLVLEEKRKSCGWWELKEFGENTNGTVIFYCSYVVRYRFYIFSNNAY